MRTLLLASWLVVFALGHGSVQAEAVATDDQVREAVARSLPFMAQEGLAWMEKRKCVTCHQIPAMIWTFNAARQQGLAVDTAKVDQWNEWALKGAFGGNLFFKLPQRAFDELAKAEVPQSTLDKLQPLKDREYLCERELIDDARQSLSAELTAPLQEQIIKAASKPGMAPGAQDGPSAIYNALLHTGLVRASKNPAQARTALIEALLRHQQKDGLWKTSSQFQSMNRPKDESHAVNTQWILLALSYMDPLPESAQAARTSALAALSKVTPGVSTESLLVTLLLAQRQGDPAPSASLLESLSKLQRDDGGWGFRNDSTASDALTTGQVLYGLVQLGHKASDKRVQRAVEFLLKSQQPDGSWSAPWLLFNLENNKDHADGNKVFSYWGSGWAAIGLLSTLEK